MGSPRLGCAVIGSIAVLFATQLATAAPVGLLESLDLEVLQGGQSLHHFTNVQTTGSLNGQDIYLGTLASNTNVWFRVTAHQAELPLVEDRWMHFTIKGIDGAGNAANLFNPDQDGEIEVKLTNMKFSNVDGVNGNRVEPFHPGQYLPYPQTELPLLYLLDEYRGFVNLLGSEKYSPAEAAPYNLGGGADPSVQVPMWVWSNPNYGYEFSQLDNGHLTGFRLGGIQDFGGSGPLRTGALPLTPVLYPQVPPYFGPTSVPSPENCGFVSEIGFNLNMRGYIVPEPATLVLLLVPMLLMKTCKLRRR
jgi:hypothetical protein